MTCRRSFIVECSKLFDEVQMVWKPDTRCDYARDRRGFASDMTDREWSFIEPLVPTSKRLGRPRKHSFRVLVNGIFYLLQSGCQWDMLPRSFPPWQTVYRYFRDWQNDGTWARIHDALSNDLRRWRLPRADCTQQRAKATGNHQTQ